MDGAVGMIEACQTQPRPAGCWENQVKGHFLYLLSQEVQIILWLRLCNASGRSLPTVAPEAPMVSRQYQRKASSTQLHLATW